MRNFSQRPVLKGPNLKLMPQIPILLYHSISEVAAPIYKRWAVHPERFASQLRYLRTEGYTALTVSQLVEIRTTKDGALPERPVLLTFDDGLADFYTGALPCLRQYGFAATLYITTDYVGQTSRWLLPDGEGERPMLTWEQVAEIDASGIECGAHTRSHPQLDVLTLKEAREEIAGSKVDLEQHLGKPVTSFAYPHGYHSSAIKRLVQQLGFTSACAVKHAMSTPLDDITALARIIISGDTDLGTLKKLLKGEGLQVAPKREKLETVGWRYVRRAKKTLSRLPFQKGEMYG